MQRISKYGDNQNISFTAFTPDNVLNSMLNSLIYELFFDVITYKSFLAHAVEFIMGLGDLLGLIFLSLFVPVMQTGSITLQCHKHILCRRTSYSANLPCSHTGL